MKRLIGAVRVGMIVALVAGTAAGLLVLLAVAGAIDTGGALDAIHVSVDGEPVDTMWLALGAGGVAMFGVVVATLVVMAVLLGLALVLPLILAVALGVAGVAIVFGLIAALLGVATSLAPLVVLVLLAAGLYAGLHALLRRRRARPPAA